MESDLLGEGTEAFGQGLSGGLQRRSGGFGGFGSRSRFGRGGFRWWIRWEWILVAAMAATAVLGGRVAKLLW